MKKTISILLFLVSLSSTSLFAQEKLYRNEFPLSDVKITDEKFKHATELNIKVLLEYDTDRLLAPLVKEAGLPQKAEYFPNWEGLDGHIIGHYLSALALHYATTQNERCKERMDYIVSEMKRCQDANGDGYIGGVPDGKKIWSEIRKGNPMIVWNYWVPWYNVHKTFAGLRDAWVYGANKQARDMFLKLCDWGISVTASLTAEQMKSMVAQEYGGMNEVYADAYLITGNEKYLKTAKRFGSDYLYEETHKKIDNLNNKHANTQVPKAVGYHRTGEVSGDKDQLTAGEFFWETVVNNRTLSFGGNSRREHFPSAEDCFSYMEEREGPESCNTYNMLKLTASLFRLNPSAKYTDYYERAMYNHILSTQHPIHGGYVYFTPARPAHYRVYSSPNNGMWCCVGTGMENHAKYGELIYTHTHDSLYVNLFVASELNWKEKGIQVIQSTQFPNEESIKLTINPQKSSQFTMLIRCPWWIKSGKMEVICNGKNYAENAQPSSYIAINRKWKKGDIVEIKVPMKTTIEHLPNEPNYISILHGPILLGARMGTNDLKGLVADDHRWAHIAHGPLVSLFDTPPLLGTTEEIQNKLENMKPISGKPLSFTVPGLFNDDKYKNLILEPFYNIHDSRYMIYWLSATEKEYNHIIERRKEDERTKLILDSRSIDMVNTGEQQPEADHLMKQTNSHSGVYLEEPWRNAVSEGYFQYNMKTNEMESLSLMIRYWGKEKEKCIFDIYIDNHFLITENLFNKWDKNEFVNVEYEIPTVLLKGKKSITVKFIPKKDYETGRIFYVRLLKE